MKEKIQAVWTDENVCLKTKGEWGAEARPNEPASYAWLRRTLGDWYALSIRVHMGGRPAIFGANELAMAKKHGKMAVESGRAARATMAGYAQHADEELGKVEIFGYYQTAG